MDDARKQARCSCETAMDDFERTRTFTGAQILEATARGSECVREHKVHEYVSHDEGSGWGDSWVFQTPDEKLWRHSRLFTETTEADESYECEQVMEIEEAATGYDEIGSRGYGTMHVARCDRCGTQTDLDSLHVKSLCGRCDD